MEILLISSFQSQKITRIDVAPPLSLLLLLGNLLRYHHQARLLDLNLFSCRDDVDQETQLIQAILQEIKDPQTLIGFSSFTTRHFPFVRRAARAIKEKHDDIHIVVGGIHVSLFAYDILQHCPEIDYAVIGEGEQQIVALADQLVKQWQPRSFSIPAFGWRDQNNRIQINPTGSLVENIDDIYIPAWNTVDFTHYYRDHSAWYNPRQHNIRISIPIQTSRGCPFSCNFCSAIQVYGRRYRARSPKHVVDEIQYHVEQHGHTYFGFVDDNFTVSKKHIIEIANQIVQRGLQIQFESFSGYHVATLDQEVIAALVAAGCVYTIMPIEHGNDYLRTNIIGKQLSKDKIYEVAALYRQYPVLTRGVFIMGFPEDTHDTLQDTLTMIEEIQLDLIDVFTLIPYPGTRVFEQSLTQNLLINAIDVTALWSGELELDNQSNAFYLKPMQLTLDDLQYWRSKFDGITQQHLAQWLSVRLDSLSRTSVLHRESF
jgi:radical SAM superfamily enzyme YgiQ (UPF0313 family)